MMEISLFIVFSTVSLVFGSRKPEICRGIDISRERNVQLRDFVDLWYIHLLVDETTNGVEDYKYFYELINGGKSLQVNIFGRSRKTGKCVRSLLVDKQNIRNRPCFLAQQLEPNVINDIEFIGTFLNDAKTQVLLYVCLDFDEKRSKCNTVFAAGGTRNNSLRYGEKDVFENKMREFGIKIPSSGLKLQRPTTNMCGADFLRRKRFQGRKQRPRKLYRY